MFQPFFLQADLPYSSIRGEEFPVKIALYNYLDTEQKIQVDLEAVRLVRAASARRRSP